MRDYIGKTVAQYRVSSLQGMGGMALVYRAYDLHLDRDVVIKLIRADAIAEEHHERIMHRFEREARAHAGFSHPNIVPVYDYGELDGIPYLVMAYLPGGTLKDKIGRPVNFQSAIHYIKPVADALSYAHKLGVVHRDVKPSNILISSEDRPALTDFGIAQLLEVDEKTLTGTGLGVGTPEYMAPEQWMGKSCEASDQYALGVVFYELITGQRPYQADTPVGFALQQKRGPLIPPSDVVQHIPGCFENVILQMLSYDPANRYRDMEEVSLALGDLEKWIKHNHDLPISQEKQNNKEKSSSNTTQSLIHQNERINKTGKLSKNKNHDDKLSSTHRKKKRNWVIGIVFSCLILLSVILILWKRDGASFQAAVQPTLISSVNTPEPSLIPTLASATPLIHRYFDTNPDCSTIIHAINNQHPYTCGRINRLRTARG
jgi:serine/threonine protein kinase